jgi:hypothetical protein
MMNIGCSKHVEENKNWIKTLLWKVHSVGQYYITVSQCTVQKHKIETQVSLLQDIVELFLE